MGKQCLLRFTGNPKHFYKRWWEMYFQSISTFFFPVIISLLRDVSYFFSTSFQFDHLIHPTPWLCTCVLDASFSSWHQCIVPYGSNSTHKSSYRKLVYWISFVCAFFLPPSSTRDEIFMVVYSCAGYLSQLNRSTYANLKQIIEYEDPNLLTLCMTGLMESMLIFQGR